MTTKRRLLRSFVLALLGSGLVVSTHAATKNWGATSGNVTTNINSGQAWGGTQPGNGDDAFMVFNRSSGNPNPGTIIITNNNLAGDTFTADSLSITNTGSRDNVFIYFKAPVYFTNGTGRLNFAGTTGARDIALTFSNSLTFKVINFTGGGGSGNATLTLAGGATGTDLNFTGSGNNDLFITGGLGLSGNFTVTGGSAANTIVISNAPVTIAGRLTVNGTGTTPYFTVTNTTVTVTNGLAGSGQIDLLNRAVLNLGGVATNYGVINLAAGAALDGSTLTNQSTGTISGSGFIKNLVVNQGRLVFNGVTVSNNLLQTAGSFTLIGNSTITGDTTINGGFANLLGNRLTMPQIVIGPSGTLSNTTTGATIAGGVTNDGTVFFNNDVFVLGAVTNTGLWTHRGHISNDVFNAGSMFLVKNSINARVVGDIVNTGFLSFDTNAFPTVQGSVTNSGSIAFSGTITANYVQTPGGSLTVSALSTNNLISGTASITAGNFDLNGRTIAIGQTVISGTGVLTNNGANAAFNGPISNANVIAVTANTYFNGLITNTGAMYFQGTISNLLANSGSFNLNNNATLTVAPANTGTMDVDGRVLTVTTAWANNGSLLLSGGTVAGSNLSNALAGTVAGFGTVSSTLTNLGVVAATNGELRLTGIASGAGAYQAVAGDSAATLTFAGGGSISTLLNTNATIRIETLLTNASVFVNQGTLALAGGTYYSAAAVTNAANQVITNVGNGTLNAAGVFNFGSLQAATASTLTVSNLVAQGGTVFVAAGGTLTTTGSGALTNFGTINLGGANAILNLRTAALTNLVGGTITGGGTIQNSAQVINLGNIIATSSAAELVITNASTVGNAGTIGASAGATLNFGSASALITNFGTIQMSGGTLRSGTITNLASGEIAGFGTISNVVVNLGTVHAANGTLTVVTNFVQNANVLVANDGVLNVVRVWTNAGTVSIVAGGQLTGGTVTNLSSATITNFGAINTLVVNQGQVVLGGLIQNLQQTAGTNTVSGSGSVTGTATITGGLFDLAGGTYSNGLMIVSGAGVLTNAVSGATFNGGLSNAAIVAVTADTFFNGPVTNTGAFFFRGAISNAVVNRGSITLNNNATFTATPVNSGTLNIASSILTVVPAWSNSGTILLGGGALAGGTVTNAGTIAAAAGGSVAGVVNTSVGTIQATNGTLVFLQSPVMNGTLNVAGTAQFGASSQFIVTNAGTINLLGGTILDRDLFNQGKIVTVSGGGLISNALINDVSGFIISSNGTLVLTPDLVNFGVITNSAELIVSNVTAGTFGTVTNAGTILMAGGSFSASTVTNTGSITGFGTFNATILNTGNLNATNGVLTVLNAPTQNGTVNVATNGTLNVTPDWSNAGTLRVNGGFVTGGNLTNNSANFAGFGTISNTVVNLATLTATNGTLNFATAPVQSGTLNVANNGTLNVLQAWQNSGTLNLAGGTVIGSTLTNAGSLTGSGTVTPTVVNNGTISLGAGQTLNFTATTLSNSASAVIKNTGGTIAMTSASANFIMTAGSGSNAFDFSSGTLLFSAVSGTKTLTLASLDLGNSFTATNNNYFVANLQLSAGTLVLAGDGTRALYVDNLLLLSGETFNLNNFIVYYKTAVQTNGVTFVNGTGSNFIRLGSGGLFVFLPTSGTQDFDTTGNWDRGLTPVLSADQARITTASATSMLVTQNTALASFALQDLVIGNSGGGVSTLLVQRNQTWTDGGTIDGGGRVIVSNNVVLTAPVTVNGGTLNNNGTVNGLITIAGGTADGRYTNTGVIAVNSGTLAGFIRNQAAGMISNQIAGVVASSGVLTNAGLFVTLGGVSNDLVNISGGNVDLRGGDVRGAVVNDSGATVNVTNGTTSVGVFRNSGVLNLASSGTLSGGTVTNLTTLTVNNGGNVDGRVVNSSAATIAAITGTLRLGSLTNAGVVTVGSAGTLNLVQASQNTGTLLLNGGTLTGGNLTNTANVAGSGTITSLLVNQSLLTVSNGTLNVTTAPVLTAGGVSITPSGVLNITPDWSSSGTIAFGAGGAITGGTLTNLNATASAITGTGFIKSMLVNSGRLDVNGLTVSNDFVQTAGGSFTLSGNGTITGTATISGGTVNLLGHKLTATTLAIGSNGALTNTVASGILAGALTNSGTVYFSADTTVTGPVFNNGTFIAVRPVSGSPNFVLSNQLVNAGTLIISNAVDNSVSILTFAVNGVAGSAVTNESTGSIVFFAATNRESLSNVVNSGSWVNKGTMTFTRPSSSSGSPFFKLLLNEAGATFSNAVGGQLIVRSDNIANIEILADRAVNLGTNLIQSGTLTYLTRTGAANGLTNSGVIALNGGNLVADGGVVNAGGLIQSVGNTGTLASPLDNLAGATLEASQGGKLVLLSTPNQLGNITVTNSGTLQLGSAANLAWSNAGFVFLKDGTIASGTLTNTAAGEIRGAGTLTGAVRNLGLLTGTNGNLILASGLLGSTNSGIISVVTGGGIVIGTASNLFVNNSATIDLQGGSTFSGSITNLATGTITNFGVINSLLVNQGRVVLGGQVSSFQQTAGTNTVSGSGSVTGTASITGGLFDLNGGSYSNGLMALGGTATLTNAVAGASFSGGLSNNATVFVSADTFFKGAVTNTGDFFWRGAISNNYVQTAGTNRLTGAATITGTATVGGGMFRLNGQTYSNGLMIVTVTGTLTNSTAGATFNGGLSNANVVAVTADTFFNGPVTNTGAFFFQGAISNALVNRGSVTLNNNATLTGAPVNTGTISAGANTLTVNPAWANAGTLLVGGGAVAGGTLTNTANVAGFGSVNNTLVNQGLLTVSNGTLALTTAPVLTSGGVSITPSGVLQVAPAWTSSGTISIAAGGAITGGTLTNASASGTLSGTGFINPMLVNQGRMDFGGTVSNNFVQTAGSFTLSGNATITGNATISGGIVNLVGNILRASQFIVTSGGLLTNGTAGTSTATLNGGITNAGTVWFNNDVYVNGPVTNTGMWFHKGHISNDVVNAGVFQLFKNSINPLVTGGIINNGSLIFDNNNSPQVNGSITNTGSVAFNAVVNGNYVQTAGSLVINQAAGNAQVKGTASISGGTFDLAGKTYSNALMVVSGTGVLTNNVSGATFNGALSNANVIAVTANTFFNNAVTNTGAFYFQGTISNGLVNSGSFNLNNNATLTVAPVNTGTIDIDGAKLTVNPAWVNAGTLLASGGTLVGGTVTNTGVLSGSGTVSNLIVNLGAINVSGGTMLVVTGPVQNATVNVANTGILNVVPAWTNNGIVSVVAGGQVTGGNLTNLSSATITNFGVFNTLVVNQGRVVLGGLIQNLQQTAGTNTVSGSGSVTGTATITGGLFDLNGGTYSNGLMIVAGTGVMSNAIAGATFNGGLSNAATVAVTANTFFKGVITNTGAFYFQGAISNALVNSGSLTLNANGTITAAPVNSGTVLVGGTTFTVVPAWANAGTIIVSGGVIGGGVATNSGNIYGFGSVGTTLVNAGILAATNGTLSVSSLTNTSTGQIFLRSTGTLSAGIVTNLGTLSAFSGGNVSAVFNALGGTIQATNGTLVFLQNSLNAGTMNVSATAKFGAANELILTNTGVINLFGGTILDKDLVNRGRIVTVAGGGYISNALINDVTGFISSTNGTLVLDPDLVNFGFVTNSATLIISNTAAGALGMVTNAGTIVMAGGTFNASTITNTGSISGFGTLNATVLNTGNLNVTNGVLTVAITPTQNGTIDVAANSTLNVAPAWANANTILLNGGVLAGGATTNNVGATFAGFGTVSNALVNFGTLRATNGTLNIVNAPTQTGTINIANSGTLNVVTAWQNAGTLNLTGGTVIGGTLTNAGSITGSGTFTPTVVNTGTMTLTAGQQLNFTATTLSNSATAVIKNTGGTIALTDANANFIMTSGAGSNAFDFGSGTLTFSGATGTKTLGLASLDQGSAFSATNNNYFVANLQLAAGTLQLTGDGTRALYVDNLILVSGQTFNLNNFIVYYKTSVQTNGVTLVNGGATNFIQLGTGGIYLFLPAIGTNDYDTAANWNAGNVPVHPTDQVRITTASASSVLVTQNTAAASFAIKDLQIGNSGGGTNTLQVQRNQTWSNGGTIDAGGRIVISNNVTLNATLTVNGGTLNNNGTFTGLLTVAGGTADGRYTNSGAILINSGTLGGFILNQAAGTITNLAGGVVASSGVLSNAGRLVSFGGISNSLHNSSTLELSGDVRGLLVNAAGGTTRVTNGLVTVMGGVSNAVGGLINLRSAGTLSGGVITNLGTIAAVAGGNIDADIVNTAVGAIQGTNGTLRLGGKLTNLGNLNVTNTTWNAVGGISNAATGNIFLRSAGTLNGSTITNLGTIAAVAGGNVGAQVINAGTIRATNQTLNLSGGLVNQNLLIVGNNIGNNATAIVGNASSGVFDNRGGEVRFESNWIGLTNAAVMIVSNAYVDSSTSVISNYRNSASILNFIANRVVTNSGLMRFSLDIIKGALADIDTNVMVIVASGSNTFYNTGTFIAEQRDVQTGGGGAYPPAFVIFSNQFVNAGSLIVTNTGANKSRDLFFNVTGGTVTNEAAGKMLFVVNGSPATTTVTIEKGGFVNAGSLTFNDTPTSTENLMLTLSQAGATYSNAPGGMLILLPNNSGTVVFNADNMVNAGTNLLQGGALRVNSRTGGPGSMLNSGTILFSGGVLNVATLTNAATGVYKMTVNGQTVNNANTILNFGTIDTDGGTLQNSGVIDLRGGFFSGLLNNSAAGPLSVTNGTTTVLSGGILNAGNFFVHNAGTLLGGTVTNQSGGVIATVEGGNLNAVVVNLVGGTLHATNQTLNLFSNLVNNGTINITAGKLNVTSAWVNAGTVTMNGGTLVGGNLTNNVRLTGFGTISNLFANAGAVVATNGTLSILVTSTNTGSITVAGGAASGVLNVAPAWANAGFLSVIGAGNTTGGNLTNLASGTVTNTGVINTLVVNQGRVVMAGTISNDFQQTSGTNFLSGNSTVTGVANVSGGLFNLNGRTSTYGELIVGGSAVVSNGVAGATVNGGVSNAATVVALQSVFFNGAVTNVGAFTWSGAISNNFVQGAGTTTLAGSSRITGTAKVNGGLFDLRGNFLTNSQMIVDAAAVLSNGIAGAVFIGDVTNAGVVAVAANTTVRGALTNTGLVRVSSGTLTVENAFAQAGSLTVANTGSLNVTPAWDNSGTILLNGGYIAGGTATNLASGQISAFGTISTLVNRGELNVTGGVLRMTGTLVQTGHVDIASSSTLSVAGSWNNGGSIDIRGGVVDGSSLVNGGTITGYGSLSAAVANPGYIRATNGLLFIQALTGNQSTGTLEINSGATLQANGITSWLNTGNAVMLGGTLLGGTITNASRITGTGNILTTVANASGGTITATGGGTLTLSNLSRQDGSVNILGTLLVSSAWANSAAGTITLNGGVLGGGAFTVDGVVSGNGTITANTIISSSKTVTVSGADLNFTALTSMQGGLIDGAPMLNNSGTVSGFGSLSATYANTGYTRASNGTLYVAALAGNENAGTIEASAGGTLNAGTAWANNGRVILSGGTVIGGDITNNVGRLLTGFGTIAPNLVNNGTMLVNNAGQTLRLEGASFINTASGVLSVNNSRLIVNGAFTNAGTFSMISGIGTFNSTVVNSGAWISDPTTNVFHNTMTVTSSGFVQMTPGDVYIFSNDNSSAASFVNLSTNSAQNDTKRGKFLFSGTLGLTQDLFVAGHDRGPSAVTATNSILVLDPNVDALTQYSSNFALGTLEISAFSTVRVWDAFAGDVGLGTNDQRMAGLYLNQLLLGENSLLIISSNVQVYFISSNSWNIANIFLEGNPTYNNAINGIHQFLVVPEPSVLLLFYVGAFTIWGIRRRRK